MPDPVTGTEESEGARALPSTRRDAFAAAALSGLTPAFIGLLNSGASDFDEALKLTAKTAVALADYTLKELDS